MVSTPLKKMKVSWEYYSQLNGTIKFMFQTTKQYFFQNSGLRGVSADAAGNDEPPKNCFTSASGLHQISSRKAWFIMFHLNNERTTAGWGVIILSNTHGLVANTSGCG